MTLLDNIPELVDLADHKDAQYVHEDSVKLKVSVCGADVVDGRKNSFKHQSDPHGIIHVVVLRQAVFCRYSIFSQPFLGDYA